MTGNQKYLCADNADNELKSYPYIVQGELNTVVNIYGRHYLTFMGGEGRVGKGV